MKKQSKNQKDSMVAVIYARSATNDTTSIDRQIGACSAAAAQKNLTVIKTYTDNGLLGNRLEGRSGLAALLEATRAAQNRIRWVLVEDGARISRNLATALELIQRLRGQGVTVYFVHPGCDSDDALFITRIFAPSMMHDMYFRDAAEARRLKKKRSRLALDSPLTQNPTTHRKAKK